MPPSSSSLVDGPQADAVAMTPRCDSQPEAYLTLQP